MKPGVVVGSGAGVVVGSSEKRKLLMKIFVKTSIIIYNNIQT